MNKLGSYLPWLSLAWGIASVFMISHNLLGLQKVVLFAAVFAAASGLGLTLQAGRFRALHWLKLVSQQSSLQYILFFSLPLLWKANNWPWMLMVGLLALSSLWDPLFEDLWKRAWYRFILTTVAFSLVVALAVVTLAPALLRSSYLISFCVCLFARMVQIFSERVKQASNSAVPRAVESRLSLFQPARFTAFLPGLILFLGFAASSTPVPALGVWLVDARIDVHPESRSLECVTRIAAPAGFKSEVIHLWTTPDSALLAEEVLLPDVRGNGINDKPFTTRSRKQNFPMPFDMMLERTIRCSVLIAGHGHTLGSVERIPSAPTEKMQKR